jgi:hypothetical protein
MVKLALQQAEEAYRFVRRRGSHIFLTIDWEMRRPPFTSKKTQVLVSVRGRVDPRATVRLERFGQLKYLMASSGIEPATFQNVTLPQPTTLRRDISEINHT